MLTPVTKDVDDEDALLAVAEAYGRIGLDRYLLGIIAGAHLLAGAALALVPDRQLETQGVQPMLDIISRYWWAGLFAFAGTCVMALIHRVTPTRQMLAWMPVVGLDVAWAYVFVRTVLDGRGSAMGTVMWLFALAVSVLAGLRVARGKG